MTRKHLFDVFCRLKTGTFARGQLIRVLRSMGGDPKDRLRLSESNGFPGPPRAVGAETDFPPAQRSLGSMAAKQRRCGWCCGRMRSWVGRPSGKGESCWTKQIIAHGVLDMFDPEP